ncbi:MAG: site-specific integrase [Candidatus Methanoperedens sp.]|nr:site-specific integrase [Candidatus Methanoperedens sp.]
MTEDDIKAIAKAAYTSRDKAFVLSLYESGCRIEEILPLRMKHLSFDRLGATLMVRGKKGERRIRLVASVLTLQKWKEDHPSKNDPESFLWCKIPLPNNPKWENNFLSYGFISRLLKELAEKAGVKKAVNPHAFRHSRATFMARHLKEPEMREFFGWDKDSDMPATYVHLSGRDIDNSVMRIYGYKDASKSQEPVIKTWNCHLISTVNYLIFLCGPGSNILSPVPVLPFRAHQIPYLRRGKEFKYNKQQKQDKQIKSRRRKAFAQRNKSSNQRRNHRSDNPGCMHERPFFGGGLHVGEVINLQCWFNPRRTIL